MSCLPLAKRTTAAVHGTGLMLQWFHFGVVLGRVRSWPLGTERLAVFNDDPTDADGSWLNFLGEWHLLLKASCFLIRNLTLDFLFSGVM